MCGVARNRVFFENPSLQSEIWPKTRFLRFWVEAETGFFARISIHSLNTAKNPVSLVFVVVLDLWGGEKPGFFQNSRSQSEIWSKTRFLRFWVEAETGFFARISIHHLKTTKNPVSLVFVVVLDLWCGEKPGFFQNPWLQSEIWSKTRFLRFWVEAETGFFSKMSIHSRKTAKNPVSLVFVAVTASHLRGSLNIYSLLIHDRTNRLMLQQTSQHLHGPPVIGPRKSMAESSILTGL